jgi:hypothetical protein
MLKKAPENIFIFGFFIPKSIGPLADCAPQKKDAKRKKLNRHYPPIESHVHFINGGKNALRVPTVVLHLTGQPPADLSLNLTCTAMRQTSICPVPSCRAVRLRPECSSKGG